ncbi:MAG: hypothetical protein ACRDVZ_04150 [Jiangellaceae bacterium]
MSVHPHHVIHRQRAADLEREARIGTLVHSLRRARRLEIAARRLEMWAAWTDRVARRLNARARARRAQVL